MGKKERFSTLGSICVETGGTKSCCTDLAFSEGDFFDWVRFFSFYIYGAAVVYNAASLYDSRFYASMPW